MTENINQQNINKVLAIGLSPSTVEIVRSLALSNPTVQFDYCTTDDVLPIKIDNLNIIHIQLKYIINIPVTRTTAQNIHQRSAGLARFDCYEWLKNFLTKNASNYDLILATAMDFQRWKWFHQLRNKNIKILCTSHVASDLEVDKLFSKQVLLDAGVPTPSHRVLDPNDVVGALDKIEQYPKVVKASEVFTFQGFGSWVFYDQYYHKIIPMIQGLLKNKHRNVQFYTEDFVEGREVSAHFLCNGYQWKYIGSARDYKKLNDGDIGMNTSGSGCYSPVDYFTEEIKQKVFVYMDRIMNFLGQIGFEFKGFMYLGIIIDKNNKPWVIEINTRPGSPEMITILKTIDNQNLLENLRRAAGGEDLLDFIPNNKHSVAVAIMNKNYNDLPKYNDQLPDFDDAPDYLDIDQCSTVYNKNNMHSIISSIGSTRESAANKIYNYLDIANLGDFRYRTDIGRLE